MPPSPTSPTRRTRGAPKGNFNAVKHGFYTRRLHKRDLSGVESVNPAGLIEEIALIRVFTRRLLESIGPDTNAYELSEFLRSLCLASSTLTRLTKTQLLITQAGPGLDDDLHQALEELTRKYNLDGLDDDHCSSSPLPNPLLVAD